MKVLLLNGSRRETGCTYTALCEVATALNEEGIDTEVIHAIDSTKEGIDDLAMKVKESDGFVVGSPVYYASPSGEIISVMDRLSRQSNIDMKYKPAAVVASARRAGTTATLDVLLKYFTINQMPIVSSDYWTMVHGNTPEEVKQDIEGMQVMNHLGKNMAWLLKCIEAGKQSGINVPKNDAKVNTNFIR
ncbi:MAG: flavodoxin family protein [Suipraeoptans sp.]